MQNVFQHGEEIGEVGTRSDLNTIVVNFILTNFCLVDKLLNNKT